MNMLELESLHPTQATRGGRQIRDKSEGYRPLTGHRLDMAIAAKPIAIVLGPRGEPYVIDHHHVANALLLVGITRAPFVLVEDMSALAFAEFWLTLENRAWAHPFDAHGVRIPFGKMPRLLRDAEDDAFRSLAAVVRDAGAYARTTVPLADFRWTDLFRAHFERPSDDAAFDALIEPAIALALSDAAQGLPGFIVETH